MRIFSTIQVSLEYINISTLYKRHNSENMETRNKQIQKQASLSWNGAGITTFIRSSAIAERPARRFVWIEMLFYCYTNNANRSRVSLRSTFSNCHVLFRYPRSFYFCTRIVVLVTTIAQRVCNAVRVVNKLPFITYFPAFIEVTWPSPHPFRE